MTALTEIIHSYLLFKYRISQWLRERFARKTCPGFHPLVYAERRLLWNADPLADYIRRGRPEGPWVHEVIDPHESKGNQTGEARVGLHLHIFYTDMAENIFERISQCTSRPDLLISVHDEKSRDIVKGDLEKYSLKATRIVIVPNRGRDIGPLFTEFATDVMENYDIIGHLHSKKSVALKHPEFSNKWARFLYGNLLADDAQMMDIILNKMISDPSIGLVHPDDPFMFGWGENKHIARQLLNRMNILGVELFHNINFPVGTMFWARTNALGPFFNLNLDWADYPKEPLPIDGSILHAIERLLPIVAIEKGFKIAVTHTPGLMR